MKRKLRLGGLLFLTLGILGASSPSPGPSPTLVALPSVEPSVLPSRSLLKEFQDAQRAEWKALLHRQKFELKELNSSQKARRQEWEAKEKEVRHQLFAEKKRGPDRREHIRSFLDRRKAMLQILSDERAGRIQEHEVRKKALKEDLKSKLKEFQKILAEGKRPPQLLWPAVGN